MKHLSLALSLAALSVVLFTSPAPGQGSWNALLVVQPYPSPYLSDWQSNPSIGSLTLLNNTGRLAQVKISLSITRRDGSPVANGTGRPVTVPPNPPPLIFNSTQLADWGSVEYDRSVKDIAYRVGRFPEGDYRACVQLLDLFDHPLLAGPVCTDFSIVYPDPPNLILPINGDTLRTQYPQFVWTPLQVPVRYQLKYVLRIVELLPGQVPSQALAANVPQYENSQLVTSNLQYPIDALPLQLGKTYAWQVQSLDQFGLPLATNQGRSQIWTFTYAPTTAGRTGGGVPIGEPVPGAEILIELKGELKGKTVIICCFPGGGKGGGDPLSGLNIPSHGPGGTVACVTGKNGEFAISFPKGVEVPKIGEFIITINPPKISGDRDKKQNGTELNGSEIGGRKYPTTKQKITVKFTNTNGIIDAYYAGPEGPYEHAYSNAKAVKEVMDVYDKMVVGTGPTVRFILLWNPPDPVKSNKGGFAVSGRNDA